MTPLFTSLCRWQGAEAIMSGSYSFVLTDMHMPVMSGIEMVRTVLVRRNRLPAAVVWGALLSELFYALLCRVCPGGIFAGVKRT